MNASIVRLGSLVRVRTGKLDANAADENGSYPFFTCAIEPLQINTHAFDCKAVLVAGNGDLNVKYYEGKFNAYQRTYVIDSLDEAILFPKYLFFFLDKYVTRLRELAVGGVIKYIKLGNLTEAQIPLPPLAEQKRIAAILDKAAEIKAKREQAIAKLDELAQSKFIEMFGDPIINPHNFPVCRLDQLIEIGDTINYGVVQPGDSCESGVPLIRAGDVVAGLVNSTALKKISFEIESAYKRSRIKGNEILISCVGSIGAIASVTNEMIGYNVARAVARVPVGKKVSREFLENYLRTDKVQRYFVSELRTVSQPTLNIKQICEAEVVCPPMQLQITFANQMKAIKAMKLKLNNSLHSTEKLLLSLQHQAFTTGFNA